MPPPRYNTYTTTVYACVLAVHARRTPRYHTRLFSMFTMLPSTGLGCLLPWTYRTDAYTLPTATVAG